MTMLGRKLRRDLWHMRGQVVTIALVLAVGVAALISITGTYRSLGAARDEFYAANDFPDLFVHLERAPDAVASRLAAIPGVASVDVRLVEPVTFLIPGMVRPASGQAISLPGGDHPSMHTLVLVRGRPPEAGRTDDALVLARFADAHGLEPGDTLTVVIAGKQLRLRIAGIVMSPEWVFPVDAAGSFSPAA
ncbi:MAG: ABC transporter permease, partial [Myxococcales bacterium]|nr:ABC transporter permease [Myxococcales bacterium]